jgi:hypothetical protein
MTMIRSAPRCLAASTPWSPRRRRHDDDGLPRPHLGGDGPEPPGAEHVRGGEEAGDEVGVGHLGGGDEGAVGERDPCVFGLGPMAPMGTRWMQELW